MKRIVVVVAVIVGLGTLPTGPSQAAGGTEITMLGTQFAPQWAQVGAGSGVVWVNREPTNYPAVIGNHNIVPDEVAAAAVPGSKPFPASSPALKPGENWSCDAAAGGGLVCADIKGTPVTIPPGRYTYMCGIHPNQMHGILDLS